MNLSPTARILAVEDDPLLAGPLCDDLRRRGFTVEHCADTQSARQRLAAQPFDLLLLDILLPGQDGLAFLASLRQRNAVPVIMMSALGAEQQRIAGFSQGADDYLAKPFSLEEMAVRIAAVLRRVAYERQTRQVRSEYAGLCLDEQRGDVRYQGQWAGLTASEYRVLEVLLAHADEVLSKAFLYQQVLQRSYSQHDRSLDMHVSHVRRKLARLDYPVERLQTVWGRGYLFSSQVH